jgi:hypothetical protein
MLKLPKFKLKNIALVLLLVIVSNVVNLTIRLIGGETTTMNAEAQCWTLPSGSDSGGGICTASDSDGGSGSSGGSDGGGY